MKVLVVLLIASVALNACEAGSISDRFKEFGKNITTTANKIGAQLKDVTKALGDVAKDRAKSLASQTLQALAGAFIESFKGLNVGNILFGIGKRDLSEAESLKWVEEEAQFLIDMEFDKTFSKLAAVVDDLANLKPTEDVQDEVDSIIADHRIAVRSILGDTLNTAIDGLRNLWYKAKGLLKSAKDAVFGSKEPDVSDPVMIGRRGLLKDMWNRFNSKLQSLKKKIMPQVHKATEVTTHVAAALKHHAGKMLGHAKEKAVNKMKEAVGKLATDLHQHLKNAKETFGEMKEKLRNVVKNVMSQ